MNTYHTIQGIFKSKRFHPGWILHREDGPAIEYEDGTNEWYINNQRHRIDGPAITCSKSNISGKHKIVLSNFSFYDYYICDVPYTEIEFWQLQSTILSEKYIDEQWYNRAYCIKHGLEILI